MSYIFILTDVSEFQIKFRPTIAALYYSLYWQAQVIRVSNFYLKLNLYSVNLRYNTTWAPSHTNSDVNGDKISEQIFNTNEELDQVGFCCYHSIIIYNYNILEHFKMYCETYVIFVTAIRV